MLQPSGKLIIFLTSVIPLSGFTGRHPIQRMRRTRLSPILAWGAGAVPAWHFRCDPVCWRAGVPACGWAFFSLLPLPPPTPR